MQRYTNRFLFAVSSNVEENHVARTFVQKFSFRLCNNISVDKFGALGVNINPYKKHNWIRYI